MIRINLDVMLARRKMSLTELSERVGVTLANLSILKTGKAKAVRFTTLDALCRALDCQPGEHTRIRARGGEGMRKLKRWQRNLIIICAALALLLAVFGPDDMVGAALHGRGRVRGELGPCHARRDNGALPHGQRRELPRRRVPLRGLRLPGAGRGVRFAPERPARTNTSASASARLRTRSASPGASGPTSMRTTPGRVGRRPTDERDKLYMISQGGKLYIAELFM